MVHAVYDTYIEDSTEREIHIRYDPTIANDKLIMKKLDELLLNEQPLCSNCVNYYREGTFCGYNARNCQIHGNLDAWDHPHHNADGSKCPDYVKRTETAGEIAERQLQLYSLCMQSEEERARLTRAMEKLEKLKEEAEDELKRKSTGI